jgi:Zn-finger nucleic acid-binding protein
MKCPACFNELTTRRAGGIAVDVCRGGCGGIWFDAFELQKIDELSEPEGEALLNIERDEAVIVDQSLKRACPRCSDVKLQRHFFSAARRVQVDECPNCGGYWLDAGELALIRTERAAASPLSSDQKNLSMDVIRYLYRLRTQGRETFNS